jgi:hypothetical protein
VVVVAVVVVVSVVVVVAVVSVVVAAVVVVVAGAAAGVVWVGDVLVVVGVDVVAVGVEVVPVGCEAGTCPGFGALGAVWDALVGAPCSCCLRAGVSDARPVCTDASSATPPCSVPRSPAWIGRYSPFGSQL